MKIIGSKVYVHKYAVSQLEEEDFDKFIKAVRTIAASHITWDLVSIHRKENKVTFIRCTEFDRYYEPVIDNWITIDLNKNRHTISFKNNSKHNPLILHKRYLFVNENHSGFNVQNDKERADEWEKYNHDKKKIGRLKYWEGFLRGIALDRYDFNKI